MSSSRFDRDHIAMEYNYLRKDCWISILKEILLKAIERVSDRMKQSVFKDHAIEETDLEAAITVDHCKEQRRSRIQDRRCADITRDDVLEVKNTMKLLAVVGLVGTGEGTDQAQQRLK